MKNQLQKNKKTTKFERSIDLAVKSIDSEKRTVELSFSSEQPYRRWFGNEILSHDEGAVNLERLKEIGVVLFNHDRDYILGKILEASISDNRGIAKMQFDDDDDAEKIFKKVESGTLKGVSVGYTVEVWEEVAAGSKSSNGKFKGPCSVATKWTPYEISIVSIPADDSVGVGRDMNDDINQNQTRQLRIRNQNKILLILGGIEK